MIALLYTKWDVGLDSWSDTYGCDSSRGALEFGYYLSATINDTPGFEESEAWATQLPTGDARVGKDGRIHLRMHWRIDVDPGKWRDMREDYDHGRPLVPGVRRDLLRYVASDLYSTGCIAPTDAIMTVTRAREGRRIWSRRVPDPVLIYRPEDRKRA